MYVLMFLEKDISFTSNKFQADFLKLPWNTHMLSEEKKMSTKGKKSSNQGVMIQLNKNFISLHDFFQNAFFQQLETSAL